VRGEQLSRARLGRQQRVVLGLERAQEREPSGLALRLAQVRFLKVLPIAVHEAGHIIVAMLVGYRVAGARLLGVYRSGLQARTLLAGR
jgi:hypothetical protein